jgi:hypothetical protein
MSDSEGIALQNSFNDMRLERTHIAQQIAVGAQLRQLHFLRTSPRM